jgi:ABC-type transporter Mla subunit MlaD
MREMATTFRGLVEILREAASTLSTGQQQMVGAADGLVARIQETFNQSASQMSAETLRAVQQIVSNLDAAGQSTAAQLRQAGEDSSRRFGEVFSSMEGGIAGLGKAVGQLTDTVGQQRQLAERVSGLLGALSDAHASLRSTVEPLTLATRSLSSAGGILSERLSGLDGVVGALKEVAADMNSSQQQLRQVWQQYEERFAGVDASLERAFQELNEGLEAFSGRIKQFMVEIDQSLGRSVEGLSGVANEIVAGLDSMESVTARK